MSVLLNKKNSWFIKTKDQDVNSPTKGSRIIGITNYTNSGNQLLISEIEPPMYQVVPIKSHFFNDKKIGHSITKIKKKDSNAFGCIIGGQEVKLKQQKEIENISLFMYNFDEESMKICFQKGEVPESRSFHSAVLHRDKIYIFGGVNFETERIFSSLYSFDFENQNWVSVEYTVDENDILFSMGSSAGSFVSSKKKNSGNRFKLDSQSNKPTIFGHTAIIIDEKMLIFGGLTKGNDDSYVDPCCFFEYDFDTKYLEDMTYTNPPTIGRHFHSAIEANGSMFIYGGYNLSKKADLNELLKYSNGSWYSYSTSVKPRFGHSMQFLDDNQFLIVGGIGMNKKEKLETELIQINETSVSYCSLISNDLFYNDFPLFYDNEDAVFSNGVLIDHIYYTTKGISISQYSKIDSLIHKSKLIPFEMNKIIILGASETGKNTLFKNFLMNHHKSDEIGFTEEEREYEKHILYENVISTLKSNIERARVIFGHQIDDRTMEEMEKLRQIQKNDMLSDPSFYTEEIAKAAEYVWNYIKPEIGSHTNMLQRGIPYLLDNLSLFRHQSSLTLSDEDCLHTYTKSFGFSARDERVIHINGDPFKLAHVGGHFSERKKWEQRVYKNATCIIYMANLTHYCQDCLENDQISRHDDELDLFDSILNIEEFKTVPIFLCFNMKDILKAFIKLFPFSYTHETTYDEAVTFFIDMYKPKIRRKKVYIHIISATDLGDGKKLGRCIWNSMSNDHVGDCSCGLGYKIGKEVPFDKVVENGNLYFE